MTEPVMRPTLDWSSRLLSIRIGSDRLYRQDFLGRSWLADYVAAVDTVCMAAPALAAENQKLREALEECRGIFRGMLRHGTADRIQAVLDGSATPPEPTP